MKGESPGRCYSRGFMLRYGRLARRIADHGNQPARRTISARSGGML